MCYNTDHIEQGLIVMVYEDSNTNPEHQNYRHGNNEQTQYPFHPLNNQDATDPQASTPDEELEKEEDQPQGATWREYTP